jgi:hypothetical protein
MERFSYREHQRQFTAACDWLRSLGIHIGSTRAAEYERIIGRIADHYEAGTIDVLLKQYGHERIFNAMSEASEFVHIHTGLASRIDQRMVKNLSEFVTGTALLAEETSKNSRHWFIVTPNDDRLRSLSLLHLILVKSIATLQ